MSAPCNTVHAQCPVPNAQLLADEAHNLSTLSTAAAKRWVLTCRASLAQGAPGAQADAEGVGALLAGLMGPHLTPAMVHAGVLQRVVDGFRGASGSSSAEQLVMAQLRWVCAGARGLRLHAWSGLPI